MDLILERPHVDQGASVRAHDAIEFLHSEETPGWGAEMVDDSNGNKCIQ